MQRIILAGIIGLGAMGSYATNEFVQSTVAIRVLDESGAPITNANVSVNSYTLSRMLDGVSDTNGVFVYTDRIGGEIGCYVHKEGYYATHGGLWGGPHKWTDHPAKDYTVILKKIVAPSRLAFRRIDSLVLPVLNEFVAFDLEAGDLIAPYGNGKQADVWLKAELNKSARLDFDMKLTLTFSNAVDGIQDFITPPPYGSDLASDLMPVQEAPASGYANSLILFKNMHPGRPIDESWMKDRNYIFRVRVKTNDLNKVVAANVGWIEKDIYIGVTDKGMVGVAFNYYYNPDSKSRSLEPLDADNKRRRRK